MKTNFVHPLSNQSHESQLNSNSILIDKSKSRLNLEQLPIIELPTDRSRSQIKTYKKGTYDLLLNQDLIESLKDVEKFNKIEISTQLLAALLILLNRYTEQKDLAIATHISNYQDIHAGILYLQIQNELEFQQLASELKGAINLNSNLDFDKSVNLPIIFKYQSVNKANFDIKYFEQEQTLEPDLILEVIANSENISCSFYYNKNLFNPQTIARLAGHWQTILQAIVTNPEEKLLNLPLLTPKEQQQLLNTEKNSETNSYASDLCLHQLFETQVKNNPTAIALIFEDEQLTYSELDHRANQLAIYLQQMGVKGDVLVGICIERSINMIVAILAVLKAGGAYVPLDPTYPIDRINYMLQDTQASILLTQTSLEIDLSSDQQSLKIICIDQLSDHNLTSDRQVESIVNNSNLAYVIYTSGSTGKPKGVQIEHRTAVSLLRAMVDDQPGITSEDRVLSVTTICFDVSVADIFLPLSVGAQLIIVSRRVTVDGHKLSQAIAKSDVTFMQATPVTWQLLLAALWQGSQKLKIISGGEPLSKELAARLLPKCAQLWNLYGPTETTIWSSAYQVNTLKTSISVGKPFKHIKYHILDSHLRPLPIGVPGELYIGGHCLARGYFKRPELTAAKFISDPFAKDPKARLYKTGDLARYLEDGTVECLGRLDRQVKIRGFRLEIGEIEAAILQYPGIKEVVVVDVDDVLGMKRLVAYLVVSDQAPASKELRRFLQQQLPEYMIPSAFILVENIPQTLNGKIDRLALPLVDLSNLAVDDNYVAPRNDLERQLVEIWERVLMVKPIGITTNFRDLGGNSILAVNLIAEIEKTLEKTLTLEALSSLTTIKHLVESWQKEEIEATAPIISSITAAQSKLLLTIVAGRGGLRNRPNSLMVQISDGIKAPLFVCANAYEEIALLAKHLDPQRPFYCLESGYFALEGTNRQIQELATYHLQDILAVQPEAPYFLCGYSFGGILAWEIARQLSALGKPANMVVILDTPGPQASYRFYQHLDFTCRTNWNRLLNLSKMGNPSKKPVKVKSSLNPERSLLTEQAPDPYIFQPYHHPVSLFVTTKTSYYSFFSQKLALMMFPRLGWQSDIASQLTVTKISGDHFSLLKEPQVQSLATQVDECLKRVELEI
ncbi:amino acid adenylation domain protein [Chondrocystis sp. NIES-4102]|nr:amino acid adenylation domain protein [Chondrocystis sp. NIES-4102]